VKYNNTSRELRPLQKDLESSKGSSANCQLFFNYMMESLGLSFWWKSNGPIDSFLESVQWNGNSKNFKREDVPFFTSPEELNVYAKEHYSDGVYRNNDEIYELCRAYNAAYIANGLQTGEENYLTKRSKEKSSKPLSREDKFNPVSVFRSQK